jgi:hypothetical protein
MLSKEHFRYILLFINAIFGIVAISNLFMGCKILECSTLTLLWALIGMSATVIISKFASPRLGRHAFACVGLGCAILSLIAFFHRYINCNWNFLVCDHNVSQFRSSTAEDTAHNMAAFRSIYLCFASMMLYLIGVYTLEFKQHLAWDAICLLLAHYNMFSLIFNLYFGYGLSSINSIGLISFLALFSATRLLNLAGRSQARGLVRDDSKSRQTRWSNMMANNQDFQRQIELLNSTLSPKDNSSLAAVCESLNRKTGKLVPRTVLQDHADIERLYRDCSLLNYFFQDWVRTWFSPPPPPSATCSDEFEICNPIANYRSAFIIRVADCFPDVIRGPIKAPNRVISKVAFATTFPNTS